MMVRAKKFGERESTLAIWLRGGLRNGAFVVAACRSRCDAIVSTEAGSPAQGGNGQFSGADAMPAIIHQSVDNPVGHSGHETAKPAERRRCLEVARKLCAGGSLAIFNPTGAFGGGSDGRSLGPLCLLGRLGINAAVR